jgi:hypothetical protein
MFAVMMKGMVAHLRGDQAASIVELQRVADFHNRIYNAVNAFLPQTNHNKQQEQPWQPTTPPLPQTTQLPQPVQLHQAQAINLLNFSSPLFSRRTTVTSQNNDSRPT